MSFLGLSRSTDQEQSISGASYLSTLHKYLSLNISRLAPPPSSSKSSESSPSWLQQSYTILTLGLDPNSAPLSRNVTIPLTLGFGTPQPSQGSSNRPLRPTKPFLLRLPPDRLLYLLLRWQSCREPLPHVGRTDEPIAPGVPVAARGAKVDGRLKRTEGDVKSVRSWVGSMRSVSMGSRASGFSWWTKEEEVDEDKILLALYSVFNVLPALLIHPPFLSDPPITELIEAGGYTQLGGIDVRVPLDVLRNLQILELESYDPRGLLIPPNPALRSLTVRDVQDADEWLQELLQVLPEPTPPELTPNPEPDSPTFPGSHPPRFPNLRHLCLHSTSLLSFPSMPLNRLVYLDLSHNLLNALPSSLSSLSSLQSLNLSNNLITSVRNAPAVLGNITSLNLSHNRIDCLVGLERVLGLERVDVRHNEIESWDEVGRLCVLPHIKEIWCSDNPFDQPSTSEINDDWRVELGVSLVREGKGDVILDDKPWTWNESRRMESILQARGLSVPSSRTMPRSPVPEAAHNQTHASSLQSQVESSLTRFKSPDPPARVVSPVSAVGRGGKEKKRRPRRVINLEGSSGGDLLSPDPDQKRDTVRDSKSPISGSEVETGGESGGEVQTVKVKKKERGKTRGLFGNMD